MAAQWQSEFQPQSHRSRLCLVLSEYVTETWATVYDDGQTHHVQWLPIALGMYSTPQGSVAWENLQLPRPTMDALLGLPDWQVIFTILTEKLTCEGNFVIGSDGLTVRKSGFRVWTTKLASCFPCCAISQSGDVLEVKSMTESKVSSVSRSNSSPIEEAAT